MSVAIIDYGSGNLHSAAKAFERAARSMEDPQKVLVTRDPEASTAPIVWCCRASAPSPIAAAGLDAVNGMVEAMTEAVRVKARPFFGICVGMQLMADPRQGACHHRGLQLDRRRRREDHAARRES